MRYHAGDFTRNTDEARLPPAELSRASPGESSATVATRIGV